MHFAKSYNTTPSVLLTANHSTSENENSAPVHNGIAAWIEVGFSSRFTIKINSPSKISVDGATSRDLQQSQLERSFIAY